MTSDVMGSVGRDLGLDRTFDLSSAALRTRTSRRRLVAVLTSAVVVGPMAVATAAWPDAVDRPLLELPSAVTAVGLGLIALGVVVMLVGVGTVVRASGNPFRHHDPLLDLPRADRTWVRARVTAGAPVTRDQRPVVADAALWMARQTGTAPFYLGLALAGAGTTIARVCALNVLVGLVLTVEGVLLAAVAVSRARTARRWLSLYAGGEPGLGLVTPS
jgi:hypothetical protein